MQRSNSFTLRELRKIVDTSSLYFGGQEILYKQHADSENSPWAEPDWSLLPNIIDTYGSAPKTGQSYSRRVDRLIAKYGPEKVVEFTFTNGTNDYEERMVDDENDQQQGVREGGSFSDSSSDSDETLAKQDGASYPDLPNASSANGSEESGTVPGGNAGGYLQAENGTADRQSPMQGDALSGGRKLRPGKPEVSTTNTKAKTTSLDSWSADKRRDAFDALDVASGAFNKPSSQGVASRGTSNASPLEITGSQHHPVQTSLNTFTSQAPKHELPSLDSLIDIMPGLGADSSQQELTNMEANGASAVSKFGEGNPGGYIDNNLAIQDSKHLRRKVSKFQAALEKYFESTDIGEGLDDTPRLSAKKLVIEHMKRSYRIAKTKKEGMDSGVKLVLVDISPSCAEFRQAFFAAALAYADKDPNVIVIAHFNGYMMDPGNGEHPSAIIGRRYSEVPIISLNNDVKPFIDWAKENVDGVVCFGDCDAELLYRQLGEEVTTVWLSPIHVSQHNMPEKLFALQNVDDLRSAIEALESAHMK